MADGEEQLSSELRAVRASGRRVPDFFIVGHAKSGTTALYQMLQPHPQIYMPVIKETQFLSRALHYRQQPQDGPPTVRPQTLDAYLSLFAAAAPEQRAGEASTDYLRTLATARRIAALQPDARIVAIFREPVAFLSRFTCSCCRSGSRPSRTSRPLSASSGTGARDATCHAVRAGRPR